MRRRNIFATTDAGANFKVGEPSSATNPVPVTVDPDEPFALGEPVSDTNRLPVTVDPNAPFAAGEPITRDNRLPVTVDPLEASLMGETLSASKRALLLSAGGYALMLGDIVPVLRHLTLSNDTVPESIALGGSVGSLLGYIPAGTTVTLLDTDGNRFALDAGAIQRGATALDYDAQATTRNIMVRQFNPDATPTTLDTPLAITVTNVFEQPDLGALTLSTSSLTKDQAITINILGATVGSVIDQAVLPAGLTLNSAARTITGTPTVEVEDFAWSLVETLGDSSNSPRTSGGLLDVTAPATPISGVAADGWQATSTSALAALQPNIDVPLLRQGYDGTYTVVNNEPVPTFKTDIADTLQLRHRIRNIYPDDLSEPIWATNQAALSDWVYSTDNLLGATNGSTETSPKPTCGWASTDRRVIGDAGLTVQVVAFHRNARNRQHCAMAVFSATDGTNTIYKVVTQTSILSHPGGAHPIADVRIEGFEANWTGVELQALTAANPGNVTVNCKVYPWIGSSASVADSALGATAHEFSPQVYHRNVAKAANPPLVYVKSNGVDATVLASGATSGGVVKVSTDPAVARANPFATFQSAMTALKIATNVTGGWTDGCEIRVMDAVALGTTSFAAYTYSQNAAVTITRDPLVTRDQAVVTCSAGNNPRNIWVRVVDVTWTRAASVSSLTNASGQKVIWENVVFNHTGTYDSAPTGTYVGYFVGCVVNNAAAGFWVAGGNAHALVRSSTIASGASRPEAGVCIGNALPTGCYPKAFSTRQSTRSIVAFNKMMAHTTGNSSTPWDYTISNPVFCQNIAEGIEAVDINFAAYNFCNDGVTYTLPGLIMTENTFVGAWQRYRTNFLYDDTIGTYRYHRLVRVAGNVFSQLTTKTDYFVGNNAGGDSVETLKHNKGQTVLYGVGLDEIHCLWPDANAVGYGQDSLDRRWGNYCSYTLGRNSSRPNGPNGFVEFLNDAGFKDPKNVRYTPGATPNTGVYAQGAGNGNYRPKRVSEGDGANSPLLGKVVSPRFRYGLDGTPRAAANDTIGAYA